MDKRVEERQYKDPPHRRKYKAAACKRLRDFYRDNGICYQCGCRPAAIGYTRCKPCIEISKRYNKKHDPTGEIHKQYLKDVRKQREEAGMCVDCGKYRAKLGYKRCTKCLEAVRERCQVYRIKNRIKAENKKNGWCCDDI